MAAKPPPPRPATRIYLAIPADAEIAAVGRLLAGADIAAALVKFTDSDERSMIDRLKALAPIIQTSGAAMLSDDASGIVARAGADGAHVTGVDAMQDALPSLKPSRIVGVGGLHTRHDAMMAGEAADYVLFGEPDEHGERPSIDAIIERVGWWAEVFELPCVAYAGSIDEARHFAEAGADFILADNIVWRHASGPAAGLAELRAAIANAHLTEATAS